MDEHRNEPIGEQQTGAAAATDGAQANAGTPEASSASAPQGTPANTPANAGAAKPDEAKPAGKSEIEKSDRVSRPRPGTVTIMAPSPREDLYRHWDDEIEVEAPDEASQSAVHRFGVRKLAAVAAAVILAAIAGAVGGALATASLSHRSDAETTAASAQVKTLDAQVAQLQIELSALKADLDHAAKQSTAQLGKTADRIEKLEKAQAEPVAKIAKLSETVEKLRTAQVQPRLLRLRRMSRRSPPRTSPARSRRRPKLRSRAACRRSKAGCCATCMTAARWSKAAPARTKSMPVTRSRVSAASMRSAARTAAGSWLPAAV